MGDSNNSNNIEENTKFRPIQPGELFVWKNICLLVTGIVDDSRVEYQVIGGKSALGRYGTKLRVGCVESFIAGDIRWTRLSDDNED